MTSSKWDSCPTQIIVIYSPQKAHNREQKGQKRTTEPLESQLPIYIVGKRMSPPAIIPLDLSETSEKALLRARQRNTVGISAKP